MPPPPSKSLDKHTIETPEHISPSPSATGAPSPPVRRSRARVRIVPDVPSPAPHSDHQPRRGGYAPLLLADTNSARFRRGGGEERRGGGEEPALSLPGALLCRWPLGEVPRSASRAAGRCVPSVPCPPTPDQRLAGKISADESHQTDIGIAALGSRARLKRRAGNAAVISGRR